MNKLKAVARSMSFSSKSSNSRNNRHEKDKIEPVVGFQVTLLDAASNATSGKSFSIFYFLVQSSKMEIFQQFHNWMFNLLAPGIYLQISD